MNDLENWVVELLEDIKEASCKGENFDLHLENEQIKEIADLYDAVEWIEIY